MDVGTVGQHAFRRRAIACVWSRFPGSPTILLNRIVIDPDYSNVYGIKLVAGRLLSETRGDDRIQQCQAWHGDPLNEGRNILINARLRAAWASRPKRRWQDRSSSITAM